MKMVNRGSTHKAGIKAAGLALGVLALAAAGQASAGCGTLDPKLGGHFKPAVFRPGADGFRLQQADFEGFLHPAVHRVWKIEFLAKNNTNGIADGALIDFGTATWSSDGTE